MVNNASVSFGVGGVSGNGTMTGSKFRAKVTQMKNWKPNNNPSTRDKLELYALHKQAVSNDAPSHSSTNNVVGVPCLSSLAELAKLNAWRAKRGLSQAQAMTGYILEADRQLLTYGSASILPQRASSSSPTTTPRNTPDERRKHHTNAIIEEHSNNCRRCGTSVFATSRGLAAIPSLCAVASETRLAYLERLGSTTTNRNGIFSDGWWRKQEPLCGYPGTIMSLPETALIVLATAVESFSLSLNEINTDNTSSTKRIREKNNNHSMATTTMNRPSTSSTTVTNKFLTQKLPTSTIQSFLWPLHNSLLIVWMLLIFLYTATVTAIIAARTMLMGEQTTCTFLEDVLVQEIRPLKMGVGELFGTHQSVGVRLLGLALYPIWMVGEMSDKCRERLRDDGGMGDLIGLYAAVGMYVSLVIILWWYWFVLLPWMATGVIWVSIGLGWCFGLIEFAGVESPDL